MASKEPAQKSIKQCVDAVLSDYTGRNNVFASPPQAEEVEHLEYELARALTELRLIQHRVDRLTAQLRRTRGGGWPDDAQ